MAIKIFLDTNIILDILDDLRINHKSALEIFRLIENENVEAYFSESVITTTDYILQKNVNKQTRVALIAGLLNSIYILPLSNSTCINAVQSKFEDLEDAVLYEIAKENKLDYFITNDKRLANNLSTSKLPAISTKDFVKIAS